MVNKTVFKDNYRMDYKKQFEVALAQRVQNRIDERLAAADKIWNDGISSVDGCKRDGGVNHLKKKIWTLYSILVDQLHREGEEAITLELVRPTIEDIVDGMADEIFDALVEAVVREQSDISFTDFMTVYEAAYRKYYNLLLVKARQEVATIQNDLRDSLLDGDNLREIKDAILDLSMYPISYMVGAYKIKSITNEFKKGKITTYESEDYRISRLNPWTVFPVENSIGECTDYFVMEEYTECSLEDLKNFDGANKANIDKVLKNPKEYGMKWYYSHCKDMPKITVKEIPVLKFIGIIDGSYGERWSVGDLEIYKSNDKADAAIIVNASFRPNSNGIIGTGTVDTGWRLQRVIDKLSEMQIANIGYRSTPGGMMPESLYKVIVKQSGEGHTIDYKKVYAVPDDQWRLGFGLKSFDVPDRTQQIQTTINMLKAEIDSELGIPAFVDGSQNVGTLGRSYQGMFLVQSNMMLTIKTVWNDFAERVIVKMAERIINVGILDNKMKVPSLDFKVKVMPFYIKEENIEDADSLIKRVQALVQLEQQGLLPPQVEQDLVRDAVNKLGVDYDKSQEEAPEQSQPPVDQQILQ